MYMFYNIIYTIVVSITGRARDGRRRGGRARAAAACPIYSDMGFHGIHPDCACLHSNGPRIEIEKFVDLMYCRDSEEPNSWPFESLKER